MNCNPDMVTVCAEREDLTDEDDRICRKGECYGGRI